MDFDSPLFSKYILNVISSIGNHDCYLQFYLYKQKLVTTAWWRLETLLTIW